MKKKPIFFDPHRARWPKIKTWFYILGFLWTCISIVLIASIFINPFVDILSLSPSDVLPKKEHLIPRLNLTEESRIFQKTKQKLLAEIESQGKSKIISPKNSQNSSLRVWFFVDWDDASLSSLKENLPSLDVVIGEWMHLTDSSWTIEVSNASREREVLDAIRSAKADTRILWLVNNFTDGVWQGEYLSQSLANNDSRRTLEEALLKHVHDYHLAWVSIDFENIPLSSQKNYLLFLWELGGLFHAEQLLITVNLPADDSNFNYREIASYVDYVILMAYDEHWTSSSPWPIASIDWYNTILEKRTQDLPNEKMIIALGNYAYDWKDGGEEWSVQTYEEAIMTAKESEWDIVMDPTSLNPHFEYYDEGDTHHQVYMMDASTIFNLMEEGAWYYPAGFALWRLGSEDPTLWSFFGKEDISSEKYVQDLSKINFHYNIDYEGKWEILQLRNSPEVWNRSLTYDSWIHLITDIHYTSYPTPYVIDRYGNSEKKIALTFDDGPDPEWTPQILDILAKNSIKATFFVIGRNVEDNPDIIKNISEAGHDIGNHTYTHPNIEEISLTQVWLELTTTERLLESFIGKRTRLFRPPYAEDSEPDTQNQAKAIENINNMWYITVGMKIDPNDWRSPGVDTIVKRTLDQIGKKMWNVVLLHDSWWDRSQTIQALPLIISKLRDAGYQFVTISELIGKKQSETMPQANSPILVKISDLLAFYAMHFWVYFVRAIFFIGILLGLARLIFIGVLALLQKYKAKKIFSKNYAPTVAVIVPAYNEEKVINETIRSLLAANHTEKYEIIVVDDGSTDDTYRTVYDAYHDTPSLRVFHRENSGKPGAINFWLSVTTADIVIIMDADTLFSKETIKNLIRHFEDPRIWAVAWNAKVWNRTNLMTRWQALEYIVSQNLDRRAFTLLNCITVVPGAVWAWRRGLIDVAGWFGHDTLAEDADLTIAIRRMGYQIAYEEEAYGITEAPDTVRGFIRQRYRWMFGTFQVAWKHRDTLLRIQYGWLGMFAIPNIFIYQILFPLISPVIDILFVISLISSGIDRIMHGASYSSDSFMRILFYYAVFLLVDYITSWIAFFMEKTEDRTLLIWLFFQRFFYRQLLYIVAIKSLIASLKGHEVGWNKLERRGTVKIADQG